MNAWTCRNCGAVNDGKHFVCWRCKRDRWQQKYYTMKASGPLSGTEVPTTKLHVEEGPDKLHQCRVAMQAAVDELIHVENRLWGKPAGNVTRALAEIGAMLANVLRETGDLPTEKR